MKLDVLQRAATMAIKIEEPTPGTVTFTYAGKSVTVQEAEAEDFVAFLEAFIEGWK